jgi:hypothetical protein
MLIRLDTETKLFKNFRFPIKSTTEANQWSRPFVFVDSQDNVFHGSEAGLCILDHKTQKMKYLTCFNPESKGFFYITSMLEMEKDVYLISTFYEGLYIYNAKTGEFANYLYQIDDQFSLGNNQVLKLYRSKDGMIWIGQRRDGLSLYNREFSWFREMRFIVKEGDRESFTYAVSSLIIKSGSQRMIRGLLFMIQIHMLFKRHSLNIKKPLSGIYMPINNQMYGFVHITMGFMFMTKEAKDTGTFHTIPEILKALLQMQLTVL